MLNICHLCQYHLQFSDGLFIDCAFFVIKYANRGRRIMKQEKGKCESGDLKTMQRKDFNFEIRANFNGLHFCHSHFILFFFVTIYFFFSVFTHEILLL